MKNLKLFLVLCCGAAATLFTSCDNDDYRGLTVQEVATAYQTVKGDYAGQLIYGNPKGSGSTATTDTLNVNWSIDTDTTLTINDFSALPIAVNVKDTALSKALQAEPTQTVKGYTRYYSVSPVGFLINPSTITYNVNYGGADHKVQVAFYTNTNYSFGSYNATSKLMRVQIMIGGIFIDGKLDSSQLSSAVPMVLRGTKQ